jgi:hypothetical protein
MQPRLQEWIHKLEEGEWAKYLKTGVFLLALVALALIYHSREAKTWEASEAMDAAQVARSLARGEGFSTKFIRPVSISLIQKAAGEGSVIKDNHPDLANPPVYPALLAAAMKMLPFEWEIPPKPFWRYQPEMLIGIINQALFFLLLIQVFFLGKKLFDSSVAWVSILLLIGAEVFWRFATSGLSTMLLLNIFVALVWCLVAAEQNAEAAKPNKVLLWGLLAGFIVALGALTRYSFAWLILPAGLFLGLFGGGRKIASSLGAVIVFLLIVAPWCYRNFMESHTLFGIAGLSIHEDTELFPGYRLERLLPRDLDVELTKIQIHEYPKKLALNARGMLGNDLPALAGSWASAFFLVGLMIPFRQVLISRIRYFLLGSVVVLFVAQGLGRTHLSDHSPVVNSENLLILAGPLVTIYGAALFFILLDQLEVVLPSLRNAAISGFVLILSLPLILTLLPPRSFPIVSPLTAEHPYFPPAVQQVAKWMRPKEMMMSDMPWAVALVWRSKMRLAHYGCRNTVRKQ